MYQALGQRRRKIEAMNKINERKKNAFPNVNPLDHKSTLRFTQEELKGMSEDEKRQYIKQQAIDKQVANITVEGSDQGGTGVSYESMWNKMTNEEKAEHGGNFNTFVEAGKEYHKAQGKQDYKLEKDVNESDLPWTQRLKSGEIADFGMTRGERDKIVQEFINKNDKKGYETWLFKTTGKTSSYWKKWKKRAATSDVSGSSKQVDVNYGLTG